MLEKTFLSSRFLFSLTAMSMFLLFFYSMFLLHSDDSPLIPTSVFKLIIVNDQQVLVNPGGNAKAILPPSAPSLISSVDASKLKEKQMASFRISNSTGCMDVSASTMMDNNNGCNPNRALLRVFMYNLPPEFHFGLLGWKSGTNAIWPNVSRMGQIPLYPGGLNLQHSIEYWLTLDLLSSSIGHVIRPCSAIRVANSSQADVVFVPFFASLSYNRHSKTEGKVGISENKMLQSRLVQFLMSQHEWKRFNGKDHIIVAHHPNSLLYARKKLGSVIFVLADFGRYPTKIANLGKDVIAPYKHVVRSVISGSSMPFEQRPILVYFQGAIYRKDGGAIRQELFFLLKDEKDVHFSFGTAHGAGVRQASQGMVSSKFCLNIAGDTPSSNRLFDAIVSHCVPVIISDQIELPFEDVIDYSQFSLFVRASDAVKQGFLLNLLRGIKKDEWTRMWERLKEVAHHFEFQFPSRQHDAVDMIWQAIARKISTVQTHRRKRKYRSAFLPEIKA
ncbi:hypothetical protein Nepgr_033379 [Nepenthes gracilis]|uniref:Exostosin GT47 domain-containing protein n=1 Tax=Nepenthes gracilis TaxID=150966 RepID=A0AAD3TLY4_NEPGR|nr:hypothetical protein Nepgr_033379 [Nepenthes gracilis]